MEMRLHPGRTLASLTELHVSGLSSMRATGWERAAFQGRRARSGSLAAELRAERAMEMRLHPSRTLAPLAELHVSGLSSMQAAGWDLAAVHPGVPCFSSSIPNMSKSCDAPKTEWPELVGHTIKEAEEKIKADRPDLDVQVVTVGTIVTTEFNENRVRIWVDTVAQTPKIG
ncbi:hypothetical protein ACQ4PT_059204 [Festuca glaucescens]